MKIEHIAIWVQDLEGMRAFYEQYFGTATGEKYINPNKGFSSYFLQFPSGGARLELMKRHDIDSTAAQQQLGWAHIAISLGSKQKVDELTANLAADGYTIKGQPRTTGDGYYESVILDPEGNKVELTV